MRIAIYGSILFVYFSLSESETHSNGTWTEKKTHTKKTVDNNNVMVDRFSLFVVNCNAAVRIENVVMKLFRFEFNSFIFFQKRIHLIIFVCFFVSAFLRL